MKNEWFYKYLNLRFKPFGCGRFVSMVLKDEFNCKIEFPESTGSLKKDPELISKFINLNLTKTEKPVDGDIVLMSADRENCHVGVYISKGNKSLVLHTERRLRVSCVHDIRDIKNYGYYLSGFYTWQR